MGAALSGVCRHSIHLLPPFFLQGPVGPAGGPGFPGAPGAKVRALVVESGTPLPTSFVDCPLDNPLPFGGLAPTPPLLSKEKSRAFCRVTS